MHIWDRTGTRHKCHQHPWCPVPGVTSLRSSHKKKKKNLSHSIYWVIKEQLAALLEAAFLLFGFARKIIPNPLLAQLFPL